MVPFLATVPTFAAAVAAVWVDEGWCLPFGPATTEASLRSALPCVGSPSLSAFHRAGGLLQRRLLLLLLLGVTVGTGDLDLALVWITMMSMFRRWYT